MDLQVPPVPQHKRVRRDHGFFLFFRLSLHPGRKLFNMRIPAVLAQFICLHHIKEVAARTESPAFHREPRLGVLFMAAELKQADVGVPAAAAH